MVRFTRFRLRFKQPHLDRVTVERILRLSRQAGYADGKAAENQDPSVYQESKKSWSAVEQIIESSCNPNDELYKRLLRIGRLAFSIGALGWEWEQRPRGSAQLLKNNLALLNLEIDWLKEKGFLSRDAKLEDMLQIPPP